jgi:signal transduction histidine kinase
MSHSYNCIVQTKEILDEIDDILAVLDENGRIVVANRIFQERFQEFDNDDESLIYNLVDEKEVDRVKDAVSQALRGVNSVLRLTWIGSHSSLRNTSKILQIKADEQVFVLLLIKEELWRNSETALLDKIVGQEEERERLSREIHDGLTQKLHVVHMMVQGLQRMNPSTNDFVKCSNDILDLVKSSIQTLECIVKDVTPPEFIVKGWIKSIDDLIQESSKCSELNFELNLSGNPSILDRFEVNEQLSLYRVIQELIANVIKHSRASNAILNLKLEKDAMKVVLSDDGIGFSENNIRSGRGLVSIQNRLKLFRSEFNISSDQSGTTVNFSIYA